MIATTGMLSTPQPIHHVPRRADQRGEPRLILDAPYTLVRVKRQGDERFSLLGHAYDVSLTGARFELDVALPLGEMVELDLVLPDPPRQRTHIRAHGRVVRRHDLDEVGPIRVAVQFTHVDVPALERYLDRQDPA